jgi:hypothetical protein
MYNITMNKFTGLFVCIVLLSGDLVAQGLPKTQIYLLSMERNGGNFTFSSPRFLTAFNLYGYNNQPHFVNNNELYITAQGADDAGQSDIYSLSLLTNTKTRVTATAESEYSPTLSPDRTHFSCVRVDADNIKTQRLWIYPMNRADAGKPVLRLTTNVGYHCWLSESKLALFILNGEGNYLSLVNVKDESNTQVTSGIGRTLIKMADGKLAFIKKESDKVWYIQSLDPVSFKIETILPTLSDCEDFTLLGDGTFLMGKGSKLFAYKLGDPVKSWKEVADFAAFGIKDMKRMTVSREGDKIAVVSQ